MFSQIRFALTGSLQRVLTKLATFLPGVLALLLAIALLSIVGALLSWGLRRILLRLRFDERLMQENSAGVSDWSPSHSPTLLLTRIVFWGCVVLGVVVGISAFDAAYDGTAEISKFILPYIMHSVGAIVLFLIGSVLARFLARSILINAVNAKLQYARALSMGVKWLVLVFTGAMVLNNLGIGGMVVDIGFAILFGGIVLTLSLAVGLGSRDIVTRSLEKTATDWTPPAPERATAPRTEEERPRVLRHF
jgi:hypothetical protein